jgi:hypothetical protein
MSLTVTTDNIFGHRIQLFVNNTKIQHIYPPENCVPLDYYAAISGNYLPTFRDNLPVPGCPDTSVRNYHYYVCNNAEERSSDLLREGSLKSCVFKHLFRTRNCSEEGYIATRANKTKIVTFHRPYIARSSTTEKYRSRTIQILI